MAEMTDGERLNQLYQIASSTKDFGNTPGGVTTTTDSSGNQFWLPSIPTGDPSWTPNQFVYPYSNSSGMQTKIVTEIQDPVLRGYIMDMFDKLQSFSKASEKMYLLIYKELLDLRKELQELKEKGKE